MSIKIRKRLSVTIPIDGYLKDCIEMDHNWEKKESRLKEKMSKDRCDGDKVPLIVKHKKKVSFRNILKYDFFQIPSINLDHIYQKQLKTFSLHICNCYPVEAPKWVIDYLFIYFLLIGVTLITGFARLSEAPPHC